MRLAAPVAQETLDFGRRPRQADEEFIAAVPPGHAAEQRCHTMQIAGNIGEYGIAGSMAMYAA